MRRDRVLVHRVLHCVFTVVSGGGAVDEERRRQLRRLLLGVNCILVLLLSVLDGHGGVLVLLFEVLQALLRQLLDL